ncbi:hypothetical protein [Amycolatopsis sp. FDAARGOS 1241]|uniref:hypothetical protein n=1 Tax=Amycolatopsis sp. FDAARGOS 1241 TaxID=2778070 RepID=UPI0019525BD9|nr:hypothetical protein [Amycolatopsis sp. FDAARGOS 1241]QRP45958.1 hypothetical protein I6J71_44040 [Amycolatopsis sp. FDAARGOS 1241]
MRSTTLLAKAAVVGLIALAPVAFAVAPANAATTVPISAPGGYASDPSSTPAASKHTRALGAAVTIPAGQTHYLSSKLTVDAAAQVTEVSHLVYCRRPGQTTNAAQLVSGQNVLAGTATTLLTRGFVTAPADSALTCAVYAQFVNHAANTAGHLTVLGSSYLQDVFGPISAVKQTFNGKVLVNTAATANAVTFTAPVGATTVQAIGDLNITVCYGADNGLCQRSAGARMSGSNSLVGTQLVVNQLDTSGNVCHTTTNGPLAGVTVTSTVHHFKINTWLTDVPVLASCSRTFVAYTRVTANPVHNSFLIEANNQSVGAAFVP